MVSQTTSVPIVVSARPISDRICLRESKFANRSLTLKTFIFKVLGPTSRAARMKKTPSQVITNDVSNKHYPASSSCTQYIILKNDCCGTRLCKKDFALVMFTENMN